MQGRILRWLDSLHIHPKIIGEFDDSALMKAFGQAGSGIFISPSAIAGENMAQYGVDLIGSAEDLREHFYAISVERKISHPAVAAITETAREWLK
jgi:LysR family transcriptional activator of nhaA